MDLSQYRMCAKCEKLCHWNEINSSNICNTCLATKTKREMVHHTAHYGGENNVYEAIKIIEAWKLDFCLGNALKYMLREKSNKIEDLERAVWYIQRRITQLKNEIPG